MFFQVHNVSFAREAKSKYVSKRRYKTNLNIELYGSRYSRMDQVNLWKTAFKKFEVMVCLSRPYHFKFFKGCLPQILLSPFLNT